MARTLLVAEELALLALREDSGRHGVGVRSELNACLAGLLVAELMVDGHVRPGNRDDEVVRVDASAPSAPSASSVPRSPTLAAAAQVVGSAGPKIKAILSHMDRGLSKELGTGTWDTVVSGLVGAGVVGPGAGGLRPRHDLLVRDRRELLVSRLRDAAAKDRPLEARTALLLAMTGPAKLLELVAPERRDRRQARRRIDHAVGGTPYEPIRTVVRKLISEATAAASTIVVTG